MRVNGFNYIGWHGTVHFLIATTCDEVEATNADSTETINFVGIVENATFKRLRNVFASHTMVTNSLLYCRNVLLWKMGASQCICRNVGTNEGMIAAMQPFALLTNIMKGNCRPDSRKMAAFVCLNRVRQGYNAHEMVIIVRGIFTTLTAHCFLG